MRSFSPHTRRANIPISHMRADRYLACILLTSFYASDMVPQVGTYYRQGEPGEHRMRKSIGVLLIFILIGGMLGGIFGEILRVMAPNGAIQNIFASNFSPGINPPLTVDLVLLKLTFGFSIKVNLLSVLGMFLGAYLYKQM